MPSLRSLHLDFEAVLPGNPIDIDPSDVCGYSRELQLLKYRTFRNCLNIPTLRALEVVGVRTHPDYCEPVAFPESGHRNSPISDLRISRCNTLISDALIDTLASIYALKRLIFELDESIPSDDGLGCALQPHRFCLEELIIVDGFIEHYR
ncbi:hypothetical protein IMSHALPRED_002344, partial [Imshaugia aleurites]